MIHDYKNVSGSTRAKQGQKQHWHLHGALVFVVSTLLAVLISLVKTGNSEASIQHKTTEPQDGFAQNASAHSLELETAEDADEMLMISLSLPPALENNSPPSTH